MTNYPLTNISPKAKIVQNVTIEPYTTIYGDVEIGDNTWIGSNVVIMDGARICLLYTSPSPRDREKSRMPSSA